MKNNVKSFYFTFEEVMEVQPYVASQTFKAFVDFFMGENHYTSLPFTLTDTNVEKLWQELYSSYYRNYFIRIDKPLYSNEQPTSEDIENAVIVWVNRLVSIIAKTYPYYNTLLTNYAAALDHLMDDLESTSENSIKYNDTPQNANTGDVYTGDNYITNFTATTGKSTSPLTTKMLRLKEIQDNFKSVLLDWTREVGRVFLPDGDF